MILDAGWSLNRVYIADLPGFDLPDEVKGQVAYDLVSAQALTRLIRPYVTELQLDAAQSDHALRLAFDACLVCQTPSVRVTAQAIARTIGRYLGYVLLVLKRGDPVNRESRPEWGFCHWDHWASIQRVWLGGGLLSGHLGPQLVKHARQVMEQGGFRDFMLQLSPYAAYPLWSARRAMCRRARIRLWFWTLAAR